MNLLDRIIAAVAPQAGLARARARAQLGMVRAYEGAQKGRRTQGWRTSSSGPITEVRAARKLLRDRSRDLVRGNAWAARAVAVKVSNQVGTGIRPRADTGKPELDALIDSVHAAWSAGCAPESGGDLYAAQALAARARSESGEALLLLDRTGGLKPGGVPLALQVLEADWLADDTDPLADPRGGWADGIQFDSAGRRAAYRLWTAPPHESGLVSRRDTRTVPAADLVHLYRQERPGQIRGVPDVSSVIMRMRDLEDYHDAALLLAKVQAVLGAFVTQPPGPAGSPLGASGTDAAGNRIEELAPGMIGYLAPGEDVKFLAPQGAGPFAEYTRVALHLIAAGFGLTYHQLTGDLSQANYSSLRAGSLEFRRQIEQDQHLMLIPSLCEPIWRAFIAQAVLAGRLPREAEGAPAQWTPPRFEMVDPNRDTMAAVAQVRAGAMTWPQMVSEFGYDPTRQLAEIAGWNARLTAAGVILDTDPRTMTGNGNPVDPKQLAAIVLAAQGANSNA
jgi:lambda family phage portal protein